MLSGSAFGQVRRKREITGSAVRPYHDRPPHRCVAPVKSGRSSSLRVVDGAPGRPGCVRGVRVATGGVWVAWRVWVPRHILARAGRQTRCPRLLSIASD
jgi:hypothetical protein